MTCQHLETLRGLRGQLNALDLDGVNDACQPPATPPELWKPAKPWFGGRWASWAIPSAMLADHPESEKYQAEFLAMCSGEVNLNTHEWAISKRYFDEITPRVRLQIGKPEWCNLASGDLVPWHPSWKHAFDSDAYVIVVEKKTGICYRLWGTRYDPVKGVMRCKTASIVPEGRWRGTPASIWKKSNAFDFSRAAGIALAHMLPTKEEMVAGLIPHCLALALPKPSRGRRFAPATKNIGVTGSAGVGRLGTGVRVACDRIPQIEVERWLLSFPDQIRGPMSTIGDAVTNYGFLLVDNGNKGKRGSVYFEHDNSANWADLGLTKDNMQTALYGLLKPNLNHTRILAEPEFPGGDLSAMARYPEIDYPADLA